MISFLGVRTDRQARFWNPHMETCRHTKKKIQLKDQNYELGVDRYTHPRMTGIHKNTHYYLYLFCIIFIQ